MGEPLKPLQELSRRWRDEANKAHKESLCAMEQRACADELESLLPALEAAFRLERTAVLELTCRKAFSFSNRIRTHISGSDRSALDAHDAEEHEKCIDIIKLRLDPNVRIVSEIIEAIRALRGSK